jgi:anti-anti-sigma factor
MNDFVVTKQGGIAFVDFPARDILDSAIAQQIGNSLRDMVEKREVFNILIDLKAVHLITSAMIGEFIKLHSRCETGDVHLKFCNLSKELIDLLKKLKLNKTFQVYASRLEAVRAFQAEAIANKKS